METAAILERASPLNPRLFTLNRSSADAILLVACLENAVGISSFAIPFPLSVTRINPIPPSRISTVTEPASTAFSTSSFTTEAGRSTTSPAAIWLIVSESRRCIIPMALLLCYYLQLFWLSIFLICDCSSYSLFRAASGVMFASSSACN